METLQENKFIRRKYMCDNIVVFGPTHSGKSSLLGYLKVFDMDENEYMRNNMRIASKMKENG